MQLKNGSGTNFALGNKFETAQNLDVSTNTIFSKVFSVQKFKCLCFLLQHYRQANSGPSPYNRQASSTGDGREGPPPPYPGRGGPGHGYGEGRGHYNRASSHPAEFRQSGGQPAGASASGWRKEQGRSGGGRSKSGGRHGQNRHSQMEMQPIR